MEICVFYGPYRVLALTLNNAEVQLVDNPEETSIAVSLNHLRACPEERLDVSWTGNAQKHKPQKNN